MHDQRTRSPRQPVPSALMRPRRWLLRRSPHCHRPRCAAALAGAFRAHRSGIAGLAHALFDAEPRPLPRRGWFLRGGGDAPRGGQAGHPCAGGGQPVPVLARAGAGSAERWLCPRAMHCSRRSAVTPADSALRPRDRQAAADGALPPLGPHRLRRLRTYLRPVRAAPPGLKTGQCFPNRAPRRPVVDRLSGGAGNQPGRVQRRHTRSGRAHRRRPRYSAMLRARFCRTLWTLWLAWAVSVSLAVLVRADLDLAAQLAYDRVRCEAGHSAISVGAGRRPPAVQRSR